MPGSVQEIRYINRDENTHLWLFMEIINILQKEEPELFTQENKQMIYDMIDEGVRQEIAWGSYVIGDQIPGLNQSMVEDYIRYLGNIRLKSIGLEPLYPGLEEEPESMRWVSQYADANQVKTDFFEARSSASKSPLHSPSMPRFCLPGNVARSVDVRIDERVFFGTVQPAFHPFAGEYPCIWMFRIVHGNLVTV